MEYLYSATHVSERSGKQHKSVETSSGDFSTLEVIRVLVAEDNPVNQRVIEKILEKRGFQVALVKDGQEAFSEFEKGDFDIILMDIQMPRVDGFQATRMIREREKQESLVAIPIIAFSAHATDSHRAEALASGMDAFITKPVTKSNLLEAIKVALETATKTSTDKDSIGENRAPK